MKPYLTSNQIKELNPFAKKVSSFELYLFPKLCGKVYDVDISNPLDDIRNSVRNDIRFVLKIFILSKIKLHVEEMAANAN